MRLHQRLSPHRPERLTMFARVAGAAVMLLVMAFVPPRTAGADVGRTSLGIEAGLPLVFGVQVARQFAPRWRAGFAGARFADMTAIQAEASWYVLTPEARQLTPQLAAGLTQYFLQDGAAEASPVGLHLAVGLEYFLHAPVSFGTKVGWMRTFGSAADPVKVFSLRPGYSTALFNAGVRYHF